MIKLRDAVYGKKTVKVEKKAALYASKCECCGKIFQMLPYSGYRDKLSTMQGIFDTCAVDADGRGSGNMFSATVCSFKCADEIMNGGWKKMKEYKPFVKAKANLLRCELQITTLIKNEEELIKEWDDKKYSL